MSSAELCGSCRAPCLPTGTTAASRHGPDNTAGRALVLWSSHVLLWSCTVEAILLRYYSIVLQYYCGTMLLCCNTIVVLWIWGTLSSGTVPQCHSASVVKYHSAMVPLWHTLRCPDDMVNDQLPPTGHLLATYWPPTGHRARPGQ